MRKSKLPFKPRIADLLEQVKGDVIIKNNAQLHDSCGLQRLFEQGSSKVKIEGNLINPNPDFICAKTITGQQKLQEVSDAVTLYSNPASNDISISIVDANIRQITILDLTGKIMRSIIPKSSSY